MNTGNATAWTGLLHKKRNDLIGSSKRQIDSGRPKTVCYKQNIDHF